MTIKAFSREYLQQYIASELIRKQTINNLNSFRNEQKWFDNSFNKIERLESAFLCVCKCSIVFCFNHPDEAPETDLICECGYKIIEYDKTTCTEIDIGSDEYKNCDGVNYNFNTGELTKINNKE